MFPPSTYIARRERLMADVGSGLILLPGNAEASKNYVDNTYPFRQDSSFLYFCGLDHADFLAVLDCEARKGTIYADDYTVDQIVWMGPQPSVASLAADVGVTDTAPRAVLEERLAAAIREGRHVHFLPQYRGDSQVLLARLLGMTAASVNAFASIPLIRAVVAQRASKSSEELAEIERAVAITSEMQTLAMRRARPGMYEREIAGLMEGVAASHGVQLAFPIIFSIHGETLHNHFHGNRMEAGQMAVNDSGAESALGYAGDITRTIPIGGRFNGAQRELYLSVLNAQKKAIEAVKPGVPFKDVHLLACRSLATDLKAIGCMKGDVDEAVAAGAHAMFFQCGLGHMMGLDVHDMEAIGEQYVGYDDTVRRDPRFGIKSLRMARRLEAGFVMTVEPGIYMIPQLMDRWRAEGRFTEFLDYDVIERFRTFGGIRIEDDVVVTETGCRILGPAIPKEIDEVEQLAS